MPQLDSIGLLHTVHWYICFFLILWINITITDLFVFIVYKEKYMQMKIKIWFKMYITILSLLSYNR